jgi:F0F1-type ATP synthase membrane subunit b/b'
MDEEGVLRHLLEVEAKASTLVDDAQAEADRRIAENERQNRSRYDERYSQEAAELDAAYEKEIAAVKLEYQRQLDEYRESLGAMPVYTDAFSGLVESLFSRER